VSAVVAVAAPRLSAEDRDWVEAATASSSAYCPDGGDRWTAERCALGHALLRVSTRDKREPISLDGEVWLSSDARLDDRARLVADLRSRGRDASEGDADSELLLHAYEVWGEAMPERLAGDFAFALWDGRAGRLLCARDQLGTTPLHWSRVGARVLVASAVRAPLLHPAVGDELDEAALADFVITGKYQDQSATAFAQVRQLPPAHVLTWQEGEVRLRRYWSLPDWEELVRLPRTEDYAERFRELLDLAVADRVTANRVTVHLSGGMDSTSIAASARAILGERGAPPGAMRAVTAALGGDSGDREGDFAAIAAEALELPVDRIDGASLAPADPLVPDRAPTPEPAPYRRTDYEYKLAELPARHAPVALSGLGGDPLFWFVPWYWIEWLAHGRVARAMHAVSERPRLFGERPRPYLRVSALHARERIAGKRRPLPDWLAPDLTARTGVDDPERRWRTRPASSLDARSLEDPFWPRLFTWGDPTFSGLPVKFRHPLTDLRLIRFVRGLAPEPWLVDKRILRDANEGRLPEQIRRRPKTLLVRSPLPGATADTMKRLAELVRQAPDLERFVDRDRLAAAVTAPAAAADHRVDHELSFALGLAHWLQHRPGGGRK
jgi:asparagine synthase (glutamine-hydrolysing)